MKNAIPFLLCLWVAGSLFAQETAGTVTYQETVKIDIDLPEDMPFEGELPSSQTVHKALLFDAQRSLYRTPVGAEDEGTIEHTAGDENFQFKFVMRQPEVFIFKDRGATRLVEQNEIMGKKFLIRDALPARKWKIVPGGKVLLGYPCQKAVLVDTAQQVVAWFTPQIPVSDGPERFWGLPGLILELEINGENRRIVATEVDLTPPPAEAIAPPEKGKKVSLAEFERIREEKRREVEEASEGGIQIRIRN